MKSIKKKSFDTISFERACHICIQDLENKGKRSTINNYYSSLSSLLRYISINYHMEAIELRPEYFSREIIFDVMKSMVDSGNSPNSANTFLHNIRGFIHRIREVDPSFLQIETELGYIEPLKSIKPRMASLTEEELKLLLEAPGVDSRTGLKYTTMLTLTSTSSLRVSELITIKNNDLHINKSCSYVKIIGKGNKTRIVTIADRVVPIINKYLEIFHGHNPIPDSYLFYSKRNGYCGKMTRSGVAKQLNKYVLAAFGTNYDKRIHMHTLRHTGATAMNNNGINIAQINKHLGHSDINTTMKYVHISDSEVRKSLQNIGPIIKPHVKNGSSKDDLLELFNI